MSNNTTQRRGLWLKQGLRLIGLVLLVWVLWRVDWPQMWEALKGVSLSYLLLSVPMFLVIFPVKTWRWYYILKVQGIDISWWKAFRYYASALFWGVMTPGKVGEFIKVYYLNRDQVPTGKAALSVAIDRGSDIFFLLLLTVAGILEVTHRFSWLAMGLVLVGGLLVLGLVLKHMHYLVEKSKPIIFAIARKLKKDPTLFLEDFTRDLSLFSWRRVAVILLSTFFAGAVYTVPLYFLGVMLKVPVSPVVLVMAILLSSAVSTLPISISGLGTRESFLILYLGRYGVAKESALIFSFMFIFMNIVAIVFSWFLHISQDIGSQKNRGGRNA